MKTTLILFRDVKTNKPKNYTLEVVKVGKGNERRITRGTWSDVKDVSRPNSEVYQLDNEAPKEYRYFWSINKNMMLVLNEDFSPRTTGPDDRYTAVYSLKSIFSEPSK